MYYDFYDEFSKVIKFFGYITKGIIDSYTIKSNCWVERQIKKDTLRNFLHFQIYTNEIVIFNKASSVRVIIIIKIRFTSNFGISY